MAGPEMSMSTGLLPAVVHEGTTAVLVVDHIRQLVTYVNDLARELAPDVVLPVGVDEWSAAAGLEDVTGIDLPFGGSPSGVESLLRVAQGEPVTGEAVTAARGTSVTAPREVLWVTGLPMVDAPEPMSALALVIFLPARNAQLISDVHESAASLRNRALVATRMSFTITDPGRPDNPLIWVNPAFTSTTGYAFAEAVGRNCRFLQGTGTDSRVVAQIRRSIEQGRPVTATLLNYRKDGTSFWNELSISPVRDHSGAITHFVGVQADVTDRVETQRARDQALSQVSDAADRLALLSSFSARMATTRQPRQIVQMLARALVPRVATWGAVYTLDAAGALEAPVVVHERGRDPEVARLVETLRSLSPEQVPAAGPIWRVLRGEVSEVHVAELDAGDDVVHALGARSVAVVPLRSRRGILGCVAAVCDETRPALGRDDVALLSDLAVRAGLMLENAQLYDRERTTAETLQLSLLPRLPSIPGLEVAATYLPAADEAAVGGDWYDVFALRAPSHAVGVVVGDVMGHDVDSAARMGKLSTIVRSYGWPGSEPFTVLTAVDELLSGTSLDVLATCMYATLTLHGNGATLRYSSAGHPPAVVRRPGGSVVVLDDGRGPMLGVARLMADATRPHDASLDLAAGSMLICFTDGLTDGYGHDTDAGLAAVSDVIAGLPADATPQVVVDALTRGATRDTDDIAVLAIRVL